MNTQERKVRNRILIAEDDPISRRMLEALLVKSGFQVITAADGLEALRILEKEDSPTLAILDWMMPGLEGPQVCQRVRTLLDRPYVYIMLLTARSQKDDLLRGLESGADDYLTKPFDAHELRARLHVGQRILDLQDGLIEAREELRFRATHDLLTGIGNRGMALDAINRERSRQVRDGGSFGVILIDIDHFKQINDTYGHLCGDAVLKEAAARMARCVRPYDTLGRYGGEEFLVVAPSSDDAGSLVIADRIRESFDSVPIETDVGPVRITVSCGIAASIPGSNLDSQALLHAADEALYRAKDQGRNRSEVAGAAEPFVSAPLMDDVEIHKQGKGP
jgi:two-component system cell cycle response regulator